MKREHRHYVRRRLPESQLLVCEGVDRALSGQISILGLGGMFVRTHETYPVGTTIDVRIHAPEEVIETQCVVRDVQPGGLGVEFTRLRGKNEESLRKFLKQVRN
jgi:hypothetical protein